MVIISVKRVGNVLVGVEVVGVDNAKLFVALVSVLGLLLLVAMAVPVMLRG